VFASIFIASYSACYFTLNCKSTVQADVLARDLSSKMATNEIRLLTTPTGDVLRNWGCGVSFNDLENTNQKAFSFGKNQSFNEMRYSLLTFLC